MRLRRSVLLLAGALVMSACAGNSSQPPEQPSPGPAGTPDAPAASSTSASGSPTVWLASEEGRALTEIELDPEPRVLRSVATPGPAHNVTVAPGGVTAATLPTMGRLVLVDGGATSVVELGGSPHDVEAVNDGFVVANEALASLEFLDPRGIRQADVSLRANPHDLAVTANGAFVWASLDNSSELAVIDSQTRTVARYVPTRLAPHDLGFAGDGRLWVTGWDGSLAVFDANGAAVGQIALGAQAHHLAFADDMGQVWVTQPAQRISVVDATTLAVTAEVPIDGMAHHLTRTGPSMIVADHDRNTALVFDAATRNQVTEVPIAAGPHGAATSPN